MFQVIKLYSFICFIYRLLQIKFTLFFIPTSPLSCFLFIQAFIITNSDKSNIMDKQTEELKQTVEDLKIKLMEKERMISDNESKLKKIQFKTNRDIRELKMSEERVKNQLKQQKAKIDKLNKSLGDALQENTNVQRILNLIKQQKEKQIQVLKSQYNNLKNEVRGYERILPTYTFMTKLQKNYEQVSTYEQIYNFLQILQQKYMQLEEISSKYKSQSQEQMEMQKKIIQSLQHGKVDLQKKLKQDMIKMFQFQSENSRLKMDNEELKNKIEEIVYELDKKIEDNESLTEQNKRLSQKNDEIVKAYHSQLQEKQIEIRKIMQEEYKRHEEQIENIRRNYQSKQYTHMENLALYEQQEGRLADEIEQHRQQYRQIIKNISEQLENVKNDLQKEKKDNLSIKQSYYLLKQQLQLKINECNGYLLQLGESEQKFQNLSININNLQSILANQRDQSSRKLTTFEEEKKNLEEKLNELQTQANQMKQDLVSRQGQIQMLHGQIEELKSKDNLFVSQSISPLPTHIPSADEIDLIRNRSKTQQFTQLQRVGEVRIEKKIEDNPQRKSEQIAKYQRDIENDMNRNWNYKQLETEISQKMFEAKEQIEKQLKVDFEQKFHEVTEKYHTIITEQRILKEKKQKQIESLKKVIEQKLEIETKYEQKITQIQIQMNSYINEIIEMKLKVANAQMKASQKTQLYLQIQKKVNNK